MMGIISLFIGCGLVLAATVIVLVSFRERPSVKTKLNLETTRIEFPVKATLNELETKVHRQVMEIQEIAGAPPPEAAAPPPPMAAKPKPEHDTRMIRMVTQKTNEIQRLAQESEGHL